VLRSWEVSGVERGWHAHPDAIDDHANPLPVKPGRVVGLGAICDLRPQRLDEAGSQSFSVSEFVTLEDGRRVILHEDRGFTIGWRSSGEPGSGDIRGQETLDSITRNVLTVVLPDESAEDHPWSWLADLARARGLKVTAEDLRGLAYEVILTDKVTRWLGLPEARWRRSASPVGRPVAVGAAWDERVQPVGLHLHAVTRAGAPPAGGGCRAVTAAKVAAAKVAAAKVAARNCLGPWVVSGSLWKRLVGRLGPVERREARVIRSGVAGSSWGRRSS
jgi:hypothetical protein